MIANSETLNETASRGDAIYEADVQPTLTADNDGKVVAIDVNSRAFVIGERVLEACDRLRETHPDAEIWMVRVGSRYLSKFGGRQRRQAS